MGKPAEALEQLGRALAVNPGVADTRITRAGVLRDLGRLNEALAEIDAALALESARTDALVARGGLLGQLGRFPEALAAYEQVAAAKPDAPEPWLGCGKTLGELKRHDEALAAFDRALSLRPDLPEALQGRGTTLAALGRFAEAREAWGRAAVPAATVETWVVGADIASASRDFAGALAAFDAALAIDPDLELVPGARLQTRLQLCDWTNLDAEVARLLAAVRDGRRVAQPFNILVLSASPADQRRCAEIYANDVTATVAPPRRREPQWRDSQHRDRIRIAYASADLRDHPTAYLTAGLFEHHDRSRFEVIAVVWGERGGSDIARRIDAAMDRVVDIGGHGDAEAAALIAALDIDILVDLMGFTEGHRFPVLARRPAPIQVTYLGFPGTLGSDCIDYLVADPVVIPDAQRHHYAEHVVRLPYCYQVNDDRRAIAAQTPSRSDYGLPDHAFVFCCFNSSFKIQPAVFDVWIRLLAAVEGSVLWLLDDDPVARQPATGGAGAGRRSGPAGVRAAMSAARSSGSPPAGRSVRRHNALQRAHDGERRAMERPAGGDLRRHHLRGSGVCEPAAGGRPARARRRVARRLRGDRAGAGRRSRSSGGAAGEARRNAGDGAAVRHHAVHPAHRGGLSGDVAAPSGWRAPRGVRRSGLTALLPISRRP
nr:tetratricopeptide repeat protein [Rhodoplanes serenus]